MRHLKRFESVTTVEDYLYNLYDTDPYYKTSIGEDVLYFEFEFDRPKENIYEISEQYFKSRRFRDYVVTHEETDLGYRVLVVKKDFYERHTDLLIQNIRMDPHPINKGLSKEFLIFPNAKIARLPNNCSLAYGINHYIKWEFWPMDDVEDPITTYSEIYLQLLIYRHCIR